MKKLLTALPCLALFVACHKSDSPTQQPARTKLVSVRSYSGGSIASVDSFTYDAGGNLLTQREWTYSNNQTNKDTFTISFSYGGNYNAPASYTIIDGFGSNTYTVSYDSKGRVASDTTANDRAARASTFSYPNTNIAYASSNRGIVDTMFLTGNNIVKGSESTIPFDPTLYYAANFSYASNHSNPLYNAVQSANVRTLLTKINAWQSTFLMNDFVSQQVFTSISSNSGRSENVTVNTDPGTGRVTSTSAVSITRNFNYH